MLSPAETAVLSRLKASLGARFAERLGQLVLFGSRARGSGRDDNDLDVMVGITGLSREERREILDLAADLSLDAGRVLSPLVLDLDAQGRAPSNARAQQETALREGVPL